MKIKLYILFINKFNTVTLLKCLYQARKTRVQVQSILPMLSPVLMLHALTCIDVAFLPKSKQLWPAILYKKFKMLQLIILSGWSLVILYALKNCTRWLLELEILPLISPNDMPESTNWLILKNTNQFDVKHR